MPKKQATYPQIAGEDQADREDRQPDSAEKAQRLVNELQDHIERQRFQSQAQARQEHAEPALMRRTAGRRLTRSDRDLGDLEAALGREQRREMLLNVVGDDLLQDLAPVGAHPAHRIGDDAAEEQTNQPTEQPGLHCHESLTGCRKPR
jgi:hypothetical protein